MPACLPGAGWLSVPMEWNACSAAEGRGGGGRTGEDRQTGRERIGTEEEKAAKAP